MDTKQYFKEVKEIIDNLSDEEFLKLVEESTWKRTEEQQKAYELWFFYYYHTEKYDQSICSRKDQNGIAMPGSYNENKLINQNAKRMYKYIHDQKKIWEIENQTTISKEDWESARRELLRTYTFKGLEEEYKRIFGE